MYKKNKYFQTSHVYKKGIRKETLLTYQNCKWLLIINNAIKWTKLLDNWISDNKNIQEIQMIERKARRIKRQIPLPLTTYTEIKNENEYQSFNIIKMRGTGNRIFTDGSEDK